MEIALRDLGQALAQLDPFRFRAWAELGLTTAQLRVMFLMRETPGVTAGALASRLSVTSPTISGIVERLVKLGFVRREDDAADRRLVRNFLSSRGEDTCGCLERGAGLFTRRILVGMDEGDLDAFIRGLRAFVSAAGQVSPVEPNLAVVSMRGGSGS